MRATLLDQIQAWLDDPGSSVEYSEELDGRWAVRMRQQVRDATTVWFTVGERSIEYEAFVLPMPPEAVPALHQALVRNRRAWRAFFAIDKEGDLLLRGRLPAAQVTPAELELALGEIYDTIEVSFRPLLAALAESGKKPVRNL
jgi:hypothetical protein